MNFSKQRSLPVAVLGIGIALITFSVWKARRQPFMYASPHVSGRTQTKSLPAIPPTGWAENDTQGIVPGNPQHTMDDMQRMYQMLQVYRRLNNGKLPDNAHGKSLVSDIILHPKEYGFTTGDQIKAFLLNPDMKYADGHQKDPQPESTFPYSFPVTRPDGTAKDGPKATGTRDVLAYTDMYFHRNIRNFKDKPATNNPVGFYLVLWDDGQVEKVPYDKVEFTQPEARAMGSFTQTLVFPGEAGAPSRTVTYAEYNKWIENHL